MLALFNRYLDLVMMRLPPQAFPASHFLFAIALSAYLLVTIGVHLTVAADPRYVVARTALSAFNVCAGSALILLLAKRSARWRQTATALLGGESVIGLLLLPVLMARAMGIDNVFIVLSMLLFVAWEIVFLAHVYSNALETGMGAGILIALVFIIASTLLKQQLIPFPVAE